MFKTLSATHLTKISRFALVGVVCALLQLAVMHLLTTFGCQEVAANSAGFVVSTQCNFVLSSLLTWRAQYVGWSWRSTPRRWVTFNSAALIALALNTLVFFLLWSELALSATIASLGGIVLGSICAYVMNNYMTFRQSGDNGDTVEDRPPTSVAASAMDGRNGIAMFLPAYNEQDNLVPVVTSIVDYMRKLGRPFEVVIINDGSTDDTLSVARSLANRHSQVKVVDHGVNRGYGQTLRTGFKACLDTGHDLIAFCDSDGQFQIGSLGTLLCALDSQSADLAIGIRSNRADPLKRRLMGRSWHWLSSLVLGTHIGRDVDCGFKLFSRHVLKSLEGSLIGEAAAISPEIIARSRWAHYRVAEVPLVHLPRANGEQTGSNIRVIVKSMHSLCMVRRTKNKKGVSRVAYA